MTPPPTRRRTIPRVCRLFALHAGRRDVRAEFWLLEAPTSLAVQSEVNADGFGIAALSAEDALLLIRNPVKASADRLYQGFARTVEACQFLVHLRYANTGRRSLGNTHPFLMDGRVFAHNGVVGDLERLEHRLGEHRMMVTGDTDSERVFALITLHIRAAGGDVRAGIKAAVTELAQEFELYSINFVLGEVGKLWAFRYPEHNPLFVLEKEPDASRDVVERDVAGTLRVHAERSHDQRIVVIASERMDDDPGWREVGVGELVRVGPELEVERETLLTDPPRHQMVLTGRDAESQAYERY
jgi:predicted glutamine amidotransferase